MNDKIKLIAINPDAVSEEETKTILSNSIAANESLAVEAQEQTLAILEKTPKKNGRYNFKETKDFDGDAYAAVQRHQAVIAKVQEVNAGKMESDLYDASVNTPIVSSPALQAQQVAQKAKFKGIMDAFARDHGLKEYDVRRKESIDLPTASMFDIFEAYGEQKWAANQVIYNALPGVTRTGGAGTSSSTGVAVDRYRSEIPALMALNLRDYFSPLLPRMAFPPGTDSLRFLVEPDSAGNPTNNVRWSSVNTESGNYKIGQAVTEPSGSAPSGARPGSGQAAQENWDHWNAWKTGSSNRVAGVSEGGVAPIQGIATREIIVTAVKRMVYASMTSEQASDTVQAGQILNDVLVRNVMEDTEAGTLYDNGTAPNMNGILTRSGRQLRDLSDSANADLRTLDPVAFLLGELKEFVKKRGVGAGKRPTHIVMPPHYKIDVMETKDSEGRYLWANTVQGDFMSIWGIPIVVSDHVKDNEAFYINVGDVAMVIRSGVEMDMGIVNDDFIRDQTSIRFKHRCNVLVKREKSIRHMTHLELLA